MFATEFPYSWKYIQEREALAPWFVFGESKAGTLVDIASVDGDIFVSVERNLAEKIIKEREKFIEAMKKLHDAARDQSKKK